MSAVELASPEVVHARWDAIVRRLDNRDRKRDLQFARRHVLCEPRDIDRMTSVRYWPHVREDESATCRIPDRALRAIEDTHGIRKDQGWVILSSRIWTGTPCRQDRGADSRCDDCRGRKLRTWEYCLGCDRCGLDKRLRLLATQEMARIEAERRRIAKAEKERLRAEAKKHPPLGLTRRQRRSMERAGK